MTIRRLERTVLTLALAGVAAAALASAAWATSHEGTEEFAAKGKSAEAGGAIYSQTCVACHGEDGKGVVPGTPDFSKPGGVLAKGDTVLMSHIEQGFQSPGSPLAMPPKGGMEHLTRDDIKDVLAYMHREFGEPGEERREVGTIAH